MASSASSLTFGNGLEFSATNPDAPPLLIVNLTPRLQFGGTTPGATVSNEGVLAVKPGEDLTLAGETVLNSGSLIAPGGTIQVLGEYVGLLDNATLDVSSAMGGGTVLIGEGFNSHQLLNAQETFIGANVIINADGLGSSDGGQVAVWSDKNTNFQGTITARGGILGGDGGFIETSAKENLTVTGTVNASAINGNEGTWLIDPTNITITASEGGNIGDSIVNVANINNALNTGTNVEISTDIGGSDEGNITQETGAGIDWSTSASLTLDANNDIALNNSIISRNGGNITLDAGGNITLNAAFIGAATFGEGNGGEIKITTGSLSLTDGAQISANTFGEGNAGAIEITARDTISLSDSAIISEVGKGAGGNSGAIKIDTGSLSLTDGGQISTLTFGEGNAGVIEITARETLSLSGQDSQGFGSNISSQVGEGAGGNSGGIKIDTGSLSLTDGGQIFTWTFGEGNAGAVEITARDTISLVRSKIFSQVSEGAGGNSGGIKIDTGSLSLTDGANTNINATTFEQGNSGGIKIDTGSLSLTNGALIGANTFGEGRSGAIKIDTGSLSLIDGGAIKADTFGEGNAGAVEITARDTISLSGQLSQEEKSGIVSQVRPGAGGNSGGIKIDTGSLSLTDGAFIGANTFGQGNAGAIEINAHDTISLSSQDSQGLESGGIVSLVTEEARGNSEGIKLTTGSLSLDDGATISANTFGQGNAGAIEITARETLSLSGKNTLGFGSDISSEVTEGARGKSEGIKITTGSLFLTDGGAINASTTGQGNAGAIEITARDTISLSSQSSQRLGRFSGIVSQVDKEAIGSSEGIKIDTGSLSLTNGGRISATTFGSGSSGAIEITASETISLSGKNSLGLKSGILSEVESTAQGNSEGIKITTTSLSLTGSGLISTRTIGEGIAGNINITANTLEANQGSQILTDTSTDFDAGDIDLVLSNHLILTGDDTGLFAQTGGSGKAGDITLKVPQLNLSDAAQISALTTGAGNAGSIIIGNGENNSNQVNLTNSTISTIVDSNETPDQEFEPANITINTNNLFLDNSTITAETKSNNELREAGNININTTNFNVNNSSIIQTNTSSFGKAGDIIVNVSDEIKLNNSEISAKTTGEGTAGSININQNQDAVKNINLEAGKLTVEATGTGDSGSIQVNATNLAANNNSEISASTDSGEGGDINLNNLDNLTVTDSEISASTVDGIAGSINIDASQSIQLTQEGELAVAATGKGEAGIITLNTPELTLNNNSKISASVVDGETTNNQINNIDITANNLSLENGSQISSSTSGSRQAGNIKLNIAENIRLSGTNTGIFASTEANSTGDGGSINIDPELVLIEDGAAIAVNSKGTGKGGDIFLQSDILILDNGFITAETASNQGGNITLEIGEFLFLFNGSQINATAGTAQAGGDGGNIEINSPFIISVPSNPFNKITANAFEGDGGNIEITTNAIFGNEFLVISASSQLGLDGDVIINDPDVDPSSGLIIIDANFIDAEGLIARNPCAIEGDQIAGGSSFVVIGKGGLPAGPEETTSNDYWILEWASPDSEAEERSQRGRRSRASGEPLRGTQINQPTVEEWLVNAQGEIVLKVEQTSKVTSYAPYLVNSCGNNIDVETKSN